MMPHQIHDPEVQLLAEHSATLKSQYAQDDHIWDGSPFAWIRTRPSRQIGAIGENLVAGWLTTHGFNVTRSPDSEADRVVEGRRIEIKFSTLWNSGIYKFQQLRDQRYDFAVCLGLSPFDAHCWVIDKTEIMRQWHETGNLSTQHGGREGTDTAWLTVNPNDIPTWLASHGGQLRNAVERIAELTGVAPRFD